VFSDVLRRVEEQRRKAGEPTITDPAELQDALQKFDTLWEQLTIAEQERFIRALVSEVRYDGPTEMVTIGFQSDAIKQMCETGAEQ
jgi:hypothetical protein